MKILLTISDISVTGGTERVVANLSNAFLANGYDVEVLSFYKSSPTLPYNLDSKVSFLYDCGEHEFKARFYKNLFLKVYFKNFYKIFLSLKINRLYKDIDIVIANDWIYTPFFKNKNTKYIKLIHSNFIRYNKRNSFFNTLVTLSSKELSLWQKLHNDIKIIPNFIPKLPIDSSPLDNKVVLSIGRLSKEKGFLRLLDIWNLVRKNKNSSEWKLIIIGDGILKRDIESKIKDLKLQDSVILKPFTKEIEKEYLESSIYVMSSFFEGFGMVLAEASSFGVPCIAFDVAAGPSDIIEHNKSGYLIEDNNLEDFANKILDLMQDETKRKAFGKNAKEIIRNKFSKEAILPLWEEVLK